MIQINRVRILINFLPGVFNYFFYILIREGIRFMQNGTPPFLSNVHVLRPPEPEKMVFTNVSVCLSVGVSVCLSVCVDF